MSERDIRLLPLNHDYRDDALSLVCNQFAMDSVLHKAMGVSADEYRPYIQDAFDSAIEQQLSVVALDPDTKSVLGCLVATRFEVDKSDLTLVPHKFRPIKALLLELEEIYTQSRNVVSSENMLVDLAIVRDSARGRGIYTKLRRTAHEIALQQGFKYVIGEHSSAATQYFCVEKLGHSVKAEIAYRDFVYQGAYPFKRIQEPPRIQLVETQIS